MARAGGIIQYTCIFFLFILDGAFMSRTLARAYSGGEEFCPFFYSRFFCLHIPGQHVLTCPFTHACISILNMYTLVPRQFAKNFGQLFFYLTKAFESFSLTKYSGLFKSRFFSFFYYTSALQIKFKFFQYFFSHVLFINFPIFFPRFLLTFSDD